MNTVLARQMAARVAELIELASIFQCRYGKDYRLKPGSPANAWDLQQAIMNQQTAIASLLDASALETHRSAYRSGGSGKRLWTPLWQPVWRRKPVT